MAKQTVDTDFLYFKQLRFDPDLARTVQAWFIGNFRFVLMVVSLIMLLGLYAFFQLPRRLNPEVKIPIVLISATLPGASPDVVESLVTIPIEDAISGLENVTKVDSTAANSFTSVVVEFTSTTNIETAFSDVERAVDEIVDLPEDLIGPRVQTLDLENQPIWIFALGGIENETTLTRVANALQKELEDADEISEVTTVGLAERTVLIEIDPEALQTWQFTAQDVAQAIRLGLDSLPLGTTYTNNLQFAVRLDPVIQDVNSIRQMPISVGESVVVLGELARVYETDVVPSSDAWMMSGNEDMQKTITMAVFRQDTTDIGPAVAVARKITDRVIKGFCCDIAVIDVRNTADEVTEQFDDLLSNFIGTIVLVFITLFLFLGIRQALVSSFAVPMAFLMAFTVMWLSGLSLNFLTLFSLLLGLGMLVDNAIVIVTAMTRYYQIGRFTPLETGLMVWKDFFTPIWTTTLTTVWAFLPLLLSTGIIGEFIKSIPIVVSSTLISSTLVSLLVTLPFMIVLLKLEIPQRVQRLFAALAVIVLLGLGLWLLPRGPYYWLAAIGWVFFIFIGVIVFNGLWTRIVAGWQSWKGTSVIRAGFDQGVVNTHRLSLWYDRKLRSVLRSKARRRGVVVGVVVAALLSYLLVPLGIVKNEFFPKTEADAVYVQLSLPVGSSEQVVSDATQHLLLQLRDVSGIEHMVAEVGQGIEGGAGANQVLFTLLLPNEKLRNQNSIEIASGLRETFRDYPEGELSVIELSGGPPVGADVQVSILGPSLANLETYANEVRDYLLSVEGVASADISIESGPSAFVFVPNLAKMAELRLPVAAVSGQIRGFVEGWEAGSITIDDQQKDILITVNSGQLSPALLGQLTIRVGEQVFPIEALGSFELRQSATSIQRQNGLRSVTITGSVASGFPIPEINQQLLDFVENDLGMTEEYRWETGGANQENAESVQSIIMAMGLAVVLILATMVVEFGSFRKALIVSLVIPLALSGVFVLFAVTQTPLSFPALIGILALFGIVVNNSILVIEKINQNLQVGISYLDSITDGSASRVEPILFSSLTTIVGLVPITLSDPLWRGLGGAIIAGLVFSGTIMLLFIPVVYYGWFQPDDEQ